MNLRPYQTEVLAGLRRGIARGCRSQLVVMPTGTGKTVTLAHAAIAHTERGGRVLWVAHRNELLHQASEALRAVGFEPEVDVWVRSIQELRASGGPEASMLIVDEAHHLPSDDWSQLRTEQYPMAVLVGATATPERGDGRGLGALFDNLIVGITVKDAMAAGYLVPAEVLRPDRPLGPGELAQDPVKAYLEHAAGARAILFAPTVQVAVQYACRLRDEHGIRAAAVYGEMPKTPREQAIRDFAAGRLDVLTSVAVLTEGFDVPATEVVILARGFGTVGAYIQAVGRGLRPSPGKTRCLVLDLRGCSHEHGEPEDERTFHLDGRAIRRAGDEIDVRFCPVCGAPVTGQECEQCGHAGEMRLRPPRVLGLPIARFARKRAEDDSKKAATLARWMGEARAKGWKPGHAWHRFKAVYNEPPSRAVQEKAKRLLTG